MGNDLSIIRSDAGKKGGTNKKGSKSEKVLIREKVMAEMHQRVFKMSHKLLNAQAIIAIGTHKMIQIINGPNNIKITRTIRDQDEMQKLLDEGEYGKDYVVLEGRPGDWKAANALLDRTYGKAKETFDINQTNETITPDIKEAGDKAIWDYLQGKRGMKVPEEAKIQKKVEKLKFNHG